MSRVAKNSMKYSNILFCIFIGTCTLDESIFNDANKLMHVYRHRLLMIYYSLHKIVRFSPLTVNSGGTRLRCTRGKRLCYCSSLPIPVTYTFPR